MSDLPVILHGVRLYVCGEAVMAEVMATRRRVELANCPASAAIREASVDTVAQIWVASATSTAVHVHSCCTGAEVRRVDVAAARLLTVSSSAVMAFVGGTAPRFVLWTAGMEDDVTIGADPSTTAIALSDAALATQAYVGMPNGVVLQLSVVFGHIDWQHVATVPSATVSHIVPAPGGALVVGDGGTPAAAVHAFALQGGVATQPAPMAARTTAATGSDPWVVRADGDAWQLGRPDRCVRGASRGLFAGASGVVACGAGGLSYWVV